MTVRSIERTQLYTDIIITAIEGGINFWAAVKEYEPAHDEPHALILELEGEYPTLPIRVDRATIARGFNLLAEQVAAGEVTWDYFVQFVRDVNNGDWDQVDHDAEIADVIVQLGLFNEVVYG